MSYARDERLALSALLAETGPDAPTLCAGWTTGDLAAHLVLRERRPDAAAGVIGGPLHGHTERVQSRMRQRIPFADLVQMFRTGPPKLSFMAIPGMDERANAVEYFVHHEDVRRAAPDWEPREIGRGESRVLWHRLRLARFMLRKAPVGVELARDDAGADGPAFASGRARVPGGRFLQGDRGDARACPFDDRGVFVAGTSGPPHSRQISPVVVTASSTCGRSLSRSPRRACIRICA